MAITDPNEFLIAVEAKIESMFPEYGNNFFLKFNDNVKDPTRYTAIVELWDGTSNNAIDKQCYKTWFNDSTLKMAIIDENEWPIELKNTYLYKE